MKNRFTILIVLLFCQTSFGQSLYDLKGQLSDCSDSSKLILGFIYIVKDDSIITLTRTDLNGEFEFKDLTEGTYKLQLNYFYYASKTLDISIPSEKQINVCLSDQDSDSLLSSYTLWPSYMIYYYGMPKYSDENLNRVGKKYGVQWQNLGCVADDNFDKYNEMIEKILIFRNGEGWREEFWSEVEEIYD